MTVTRPGAMAFEQLVSSAPDAIVLDGALEDDSQVRNSWRAHELLGVPIIVMARPADEVLELLERGADEVVAHAEDDALLAARVAAVLRRAPERRPQNVSSTLTLGRVEVDMERRVVRRPDGTQTLSRTEFALFQALVQARGRACTRQELITRVWGAQYASATHYLRLYVRYLRQKLELDPMHPAYLLNVHSVGYRLVVDELPAEKSSRLPAEQSMRLPAITSIGRMPQEVAVPAYAMA